MTTVRAYMAADGAHPSGRRFEAVLGTHLRTQSQRISRYCLREHHAVVEDIATIVEAIALADRTFVRRRSNGWGRRIQIELPVYEVSHFESKPVREALHQVACFLTGDDWHFEFSAREDRLPSSGVLALDGPSPRFVVPFSRGLDSFAQVALLEHDHGRGSVMTVRSGVFGADSHPFHAPVLKVPRKFGPGRRREQSYRSRPLVYFTFAAIAAAASRAEKVVIGENGQGALGVACVPFAGEWPFRSAHPRFVGLLAHFLELALGEHITFELGQLWRTKGEVLTELREHGLLVGIENTDSCSMQARHQSGADACGICGGCMLRSASASAARITLGPEARFPHDVRAPAMSRGQRDIAVWSLLSMNELAVLPASARGRRAIAHEAALAFPSDAPAAERHLTRLLSQHAAEWESYLESLPADSWVRCWVKQ